MNWCTYFVYVIGPDHGRGPTKIGYAIDSEKRLCCLNGAHWEHRLVIFDKFLVGSRSAAMKLERLCHMALADKRIRGEWFRVFPDGASEVITKIVGGTNSEHFS